MGLSEFIEWWYYNGPWFLDDGCPCCGAEHEPAWLYWLDACHNDCFPFCSVFCAIELYINSTFKNVEVPQDAVRNI